MNEMRQLSTHMETRREKQGKDHILEGWLISWGEWRSYGLAGTSHSPTTPIYIAMQTRLEEVPIHSDKPIPKQTRVVLPIIPPYFTHGRMSEIDRFVGQMPLPLRKILRYRYEIGMEGSDIAGVMRWKLPTYYARMSEARKQVKKNVSFVR